ncbi:PIG-L family deacetylase [Paenalcaligenes niemegkensis]|uniref:PIG-L family deacetylase n=1 Tax=Paenalcaligenes niemegkensis TaxID=2895469 RepID=UPI001EE784ED|nr:PIG-L family deacetylase [Paenalcaligenes niemegkensis]MCQ9617207.1 PIG-L family deacetylase [Paenalcaligenes niemegkensis]
MTSALVVSPHYDDAVFSCGSLLSILPSCTVMTVYTGLPQDKDVLTDWDQRCGFSSAGEAMQARLIENEHALSALRLNGIDLGFLDSQYIKEPREATGLFADTVTANIERLKPSAVFFR